MQLTDLSIKEISDGFKAKQFSASDLLDACLKRADEKNPEINAFVTLDKDGARRSAEEVDKKIVQGDDLAPLAGVPVGIKDLINTKGIKTTCCSPFLKDFVPPYDAVCVEKLKAQNAVIVGKTNLDEFACGASTEHSYFGVTKNPFDKERVAGGSSGGSAACVATGMSIYSLGTDTGGSIRQPASFCNVYGLKPTYGRVSRSGVTAMASSWDCIGPFANKIEDIAYIMNVIAGRDEKDSTTVDIEVPNYLDFLDQDVKGLKIGLPKEYFGEGVDKEVSDSVMEAVKKLEGMGAEVVDVSLPMTKYAVTVYYITMPAELSANLERFDGIRYGKKPKVEPDDLVDYYFKARGEGFGEEIKRRIMIGTYVLSAGYFDAYYKKAQKVRTLIIKEFEDVFKKVDVLMGPVSPFPPFKIGEFLDDPLKMYMADALAIPSSAAGLAAISAPFGKTPDGLPVGVQIFAPQFEEGRCIKVASALER